MTSRSNPDWLAELIAKEGDATLIEAQERDSLLNALSSAASPEALNPSRHAQLLAAALSPSSHLQQMPGDPLAPPDADEAIAAAATGENLLANPLVALLRNAYAPSAISTDVERAVRISALAAGASPSRRRTPAAAASWGVLAVAAAAALWVANATQSRVEDHTHTGRSQLNFAQSRTTGTMFSDSFAHSTASERIDRIAQVRQKELRNNRYLMWGLP